MKTVLLAIFFSLAATGALAAGRVAAQYHIELTDGSSASIRSTVTTPLGSEAIFDEVVEPPPTLAPRDLRTDVGPECEVGILPSMQPEANGRLKTKVYFSCHQIAEIPLIGLYAAEPVGYAGWLYERHHSDEVNLAPGDSYSCSVRFDMLEKPKVVTLKVTQGKVAEL